MIWSDQIKTGESKRISDILLGVIIRDAKIYEDAGGVVSRKAHFSA
jgi:hypothetical protein